MSVGKRFIRLATTLLVSALVGGVALFWSAPSASATTLPVVNKSGTLSSNETWTSGNVYLVDNVIVPSGKTLTINAGTIVKSDTSDGIIVSSGGQLDVNGLSMAGVTFTSYADDSAGGDSNGDGTSVGSAGSYTFVIGESGSHINVQHASFEYQMRSINTTCSNTSADELSVTNSSVKSAMLLFSCKPGYATLTGNNFEVPSNYYPLFLSQADPSFIELSGLTRNTFTGSGKSATMYVYDGRIGSSNSWNMDSSGGLDTIYLASVMNVYGNLNIEPGVTVKVDNDTSANAFRINSGAELTANGMSATPITVTTINDDSVNGDSAGDGSTSASANAYGTVFDGQGGQIEASFLDIRSARGALSMACTPTTSTVSLVDSDTEGSVNLSQCYEDDAQVLRNNFAVSNQYPITVGNGDATTVSLGGTDRNTFSGSGQAVAANLYESTVGNSQLWTVDNDSGLLALALHGLTITDDATMIIEPGLAVKIPSEGGIIVAADGSLQALASASYPITFTSLSDDTVAGDTNRDGSSAGSLSEYWSAIQDSGGTVEISYATFRYGTGSVGDVGELPSASKGVLSITDSTIQSPLSVLNRDASKLSLERNQFEVTTVNPINASYIDPSAIVLTGSDKNEFTGSDRETALNLYQPTIASSKTWDIDASTGVDALRIDQMNVDGTFNIQPGINLKVAGYVKVNDGGNLSATGTTLAPVTFTTLDDDSVGGDTGGNGATTPSVDIYTTSLKVMNGGTATLENSVIAYSGLAIYNAGDLNVTDTYIGNVGTGFQATGGSTTRSSAYFDNTDIEYATNGLYVGNYSTVTYHGSITNVTNKALQSCNWLEACWVDASYIDWGSVDGPFPSAGDLACGQAVISPWLSSSMQYSGRVFDLNNCDISTSPSQQMELDAHTFKITLDDNVADCNQSIQDACDIAQGMIDCVEDGVTTLVATRYPILDFLVPTIHSPSTEAEDYVGDYDDSASVYYNLMDKDEVPLSGQTLFNVASIAHDLSEAYNACTY